METHQKYRDKGLVNSSQCKTRSSAFLVSTAYDAIKQYGLTPGYSNGGPWSGLKSGPRKGFWWSVAVAQFNAKSDLKCQYFTYVLIFLFT